MANRRTRKPTHPGELIREDLIDRYRNYGLDLSQWHQLLLCVGKGTLGLTAERIKDFVFVRSSPTEVLVPSEYEQYIWDHEEVFQGYGRQ